MLNNPQAYGIRGPLLTVFPAPIVANRPPATSDVDFEFGQIWVDQAAFDDAYILTNKSAGVAEWTVIGGGASSVASLTGNSGGAVFPTGGNINVVGSGALAFTGNPGTSTLTGAITPGSALLATLTGDSGGPISPTAGNINTLGTAAQITTTGALSNMTFAFATPNFTLTNQIALMSGAVTGGITVEAFNTSNTPGDVAVVAAVATGNDSYFVCADDQANLEWSFGNKESASNNLIFAAGSGLATPQATLTRTGAWTTAGAITATTGGINSLAGGCSIVGTANINTSGAGVTTIGQGGTGATNIGNATGNTFVTGNLSVTGGNFLMPSAGTGLSLTPTVASGAAAGTVNCNGRVGSITFTGISIAATADQTLTMGNTSIAGASTRLIYAMSGATTGAGLSVKSVTPSANQFVWVITNATGGTTTTADITFDFIVVN